MCPVFLANYKIPAKVRVFFYLFLDYMAYANVCFLAFLVLECLDFFIRKETI